MASTNKVPKSGNLKGGSRKGIPNKSTQAAREAMAQLVDGNAHRLQEWLDRIADGDPKHDVKPNPIKAAELFVSVIEYHVPKLNRSEVVGANGGPVRHAVEVHIVDTNGD
jgi:hypothetical protein